VIGPSAARALLIAARIAAGSAASAWNEAASIPFAFSAFTPAASFSSLRATSATEKPEEPNFSATAVEMPGPNPMTTMFFPVGFSDDEEGVSVAADEGAPAWLMMSQ
jgi:hypothetical protein